MLFTRFNHSFRLLLLVLSTLMIVSCGSGDGESSVSDTPLTGALLDGPVKGVKYVSETQAGTTNLAGEFQYFPNETIVFSIGGIKLGQVTLLKPSASGAQALITPVELTGSEDASDPRVVRLLQFLQSLDRDGDHSNGILISPATATAAASNFIDFSDPDFDTNNPTFSLQALVDQIAAPADPTPEIVSAAVALQNFGNTIRDNNLNISLSPTFQLVWSDEFNATTLNSDDWNFETGYGPSGDGWGNDEWQLYTENSENLSIVFGEESDAANGYLRISALCPSAPACGKRTDEITSAKINTKDKQEFQFGKIEARIKVPTGKGAWPAFWSLGAAYPETPWPAAGEIDFMEVFSVDNETTKDGLFTIHWEEPDGSGTRQFTTSSRPFDGSSFHIFEAEWSNDRVVGKIDRVEFANFPLDPATQSELLEPFYLILNVAMGGNPVPGLEPDATTPWPQEMLVDYIRVYQSVAGLNNDILNINFEGGPSKFVCFEAGAGCGGATGFAGGDASIQPNPDTTGINPSANAGRFLKFNPGNGEAFGGTLVRLTDDALDFAASNEIFTMKVYSTRAVPVLFELADSTPNDGGIGVTVQHTGSGWEELEFDFTGLTAGAARTDQVVLIFDNGVVGDAEGDPDNWTFYFDDIVLQKLPPVTGGGLGDTDGDFGDGSSDGAGFGVFSETNTTTAVSNTNIVSAGNTVTINGASTAVTPFDGSTVLALTYSGNAENQGFGGAVFQFDSADVSAFDTLKFTLDAASFTNLANLTVQLEPPAGGTDGGNVALASYTPVAVRGNWKTYEIPLADFSAVNPASISALGFFNARDSSGNLLAGTLYLDDIHFTGTGGGGGTGGASLPFSDDFESGDLADWNVVPNGGSITATDTQAGSGTFSARLVAGTAQAPALSIEGLGIGSVAPNDTIDVSWDMCGTFAGAGEVMFPALISERGDGSGGERVFDTIGSVPGVWTRFTRSFAANSDTANLVGGVSVQFDVVCGGDAGCAADVFIDNVNVTNGAGDPGGPASGESCDTGGTGGGGSTDPVVFADDFGAGVSFVPFGGSVNDITIDTTEFNTGTASLKVVVPATNYTGGALVVSPGRDLSGFDTLTFWAKASAEPRSLNVAGIANNAGASPNAFEVNGLALTTAWTQYTITIPDPSVLTDVTGLFHFAEGSDEGAYTIWFDDIIYSSSGGGDPVPVGDGIELLTNGDFEASPTDKAPWINAGAVTTNNYYTVVASDGGNVFDTNLSQTVALTNGVDYVLKFRARASVERDIVVGIGDGGPPFVATLVTPAPTLTTDWQSFSFPLTASNDGGAASRVLFDLGTVASTVDIDDVSLELASDPGVNLLTNGDFEASPTDKAPWINAGAVTTNNFFTVVANDGGNVFDTNLSQPVELTNGVEYVLAYRARASVQRDIVVGIGDAGAPFVASLVTPAPTLTTEWQTFTHALTAVNDGGAASRVLFDLGTVASTVDIDDVSLQVIDTGAGGGGGAGGEIAVNGGLEDGLTGWETTPNGGTSELSSVDAHTGVNSARLRADVAANGGGASFPDIKLANAGVGTVTAGQALTVSFWTKTVEQTGAVPFFAQLFTEQAGGGASKTDFLIEPPTFLTVGDWTQHTFNVTLGADASAGVSLLFKTDCGATPDCVLDVLIDDVSIVSN